MKNEEKKLKNGSGVHLVFQNQVKSYERHVFVDINQTDGWTDGHQAFYDLPYRFYRPAGYLRGTGDKK